MHTTYSAAPFFCGSSYSLQPFEIPFSDKIFSAIYSRRISIPHLNLFTFTTNYFERTAACVSEYFVEAIDVIDFMQWLFKDIDFQFHLNIFISATVFKMQATFHIKHFFFDYVKLLLDVPGVRSLIENSVSITNNVI